MLEKFRKRYLEKSKKGQRGFTLIELAIVLVIIGLLFAMIIKGRQLIDNAKVKNIIAQINKIKTAMTIYYDRYGHYPGDSNQNGVIDNDNEKKGFWGNLTSEKFLSQADLKTPLGTSWGIYYDSNNKIDWLNATLSQKYICQIDKKLDDGKSDSGDVQCKACSYSENTDCFSLTGTDELRVYLLP